MVLSSTKEGWTEPLPRIDSYSWCKKEIEQNNKKLNFTKILDLFLGIRQKETRDIIITYRKRSILKPTRELIKLLILHKVKRWKKVINDLMIGNFDHIEVFNLKISGFLSSSFSSFSFSSFFFCFFFLKKRLIYWFVFLWCLIKCTRKSQFKTKLLSFISFTHQIQVCMPWTMIATSFIFVHVSNSSLHSKEESKKATQSLSHVKQKVGPCLIIFQKQTNFALWDKSPLQLCFFFFRPFLSLFNYFVFGLPQLFHFSPTNAFHYSFALFQPHPFFH